MGERFLRPAYETFVFTVKRQRRAPKKKRDVQSTSSINNNVKTKIKQQ